MESSPWNRAPRKARGVRFAWVHYGEEAAILLDNGTTVTRYAPVSRQWYSLLRKNGGRSASFDAVFNAATASYETNQTIDTAIALGETILSDFAAPPDGAEDTYRRLVAAAAATLDPTTGYRSVVRTYLPMALVADGLDYEIGKAAVANDERVGDGPRCDTIPDAVQESIIDLASSETGRVVEETNQ